MQLQLLAAGGPAEFDGAFAAMAKEPAGALLVAADSLFNLHRTRLADLAMRRRLPTMFGIRENVEAGGLMSYGPSLSDLWRRTATFVDKILKGAKPADVPAEQPTRFELTINRGSPQRNLKGSSVDLQANASLGSGHRPDLQRPRLRRWHAMSPVPAAQPLSKRSVLSFVEAAPAKLAERSARLRRRSAELQCTLSVSVEQKSRAMRGVEG